MANSDFIILIPQLADGALGRGGRHGFPPLRAAPFGHRLALPLGHHEVAVHSPPLDTTAG